MIEAFHQKGGHIRRRVPIVKIIASALTIGSGGSAGKEGKDLIAELRCLVCQNQSLADSDAELAHDLRAEVYEMVQDGKSDEEIIEFLVARYGDFVLYKPPVKPSTWLLWFGPFALMLLAGVLLLRAVRRQKQKAQDVEISVADRKRLDDLLGEHNSEEQKP